MNEFCLFEIVFFNNRFSPWNSKFVTFQVFKIKKIYDKYLGFPYHFGILLDFARIY